MFNQGLSSSTLNSVRSSLSFFSFPSNLDLNTDPYVARLFRFFYRMRPKKAKYLVFWPVSQVLVHLKSWHPIPQLSLKNLTLKTLALVALTTSDRAQTIQKLNVNNMHISDDLVSFIITDRLKTTGRILKPKIVKCFSSSESSLNVVLYIKEYLSRTACFRSPENTQFFISWATKRPVTRATLARWLKSILKIANIDTSIFSAHSYRGSSLSAAYARGVSISDIVKAGDWTNVNTFFNHYCAESMDTPVGQIILNQASA